MFLSPSPNTAGSGLQLPGTAAAQAALQLNGAIPLGALNPAALTGTGEGSAVSSLVGGGGEGQLWGVKAVVGEGVPWVLW